MSSDSTISTVTLEHLIDKLECEQHRSSTKKNYYVVWKIFNRFFIKLDKKPDTWENQIVLFAGYLIETKHKSATV